MHVKIDKAENLSYDLNADLKKKNSIQIYTSTVKPIYLLEIILKMQFSYRRFLLLNGKFTTKMAKKFYKLYLRGPN